MTVAAQSAPVSDRELTITKLIDAPREAVYRCWTEPDLLVQWFTPAPWTTVRADVDVRPGGSSLITMADPQGNEYPNPGIFLEVVPNEKIVLTDAYTDAWTPSEHPFMTAIMTFEDEGGKTRYTARALHWTDADCQRHVEMGFHEGWSKVAEQLAHVARRVAAAQPQVRSA